MTFLLFFVILFYITRRHFVLFGGAFAIAPIDVTIVFDLCLDVRVFEFAEDEGDDSCY